MEDKLTFLWKHFYKKSSNDYTHKEFWFLRLQFPPQAGYPSNEWKRNRRPGLPRCRRTFQLLTTCLQFSTQPTEWKCRPSEFFVCIVIRTFFVEMFSQKCQLVFHSFTSFTEYLTSRHLLKRGLNMIIKIPSKDLAPKTSCLDSQ